MEEAATQTGQVVQKMIDKPTEAWNVMLPILFVLLAIGIWLFVKKVMDENAKREERYHITMDTTIKEHGATIAKSTEILASINNNQVQIKDSLCKIENRVEDIEDHIGLKGAAQ